MKKGDFYKILCTSTPEEINEFISLKGSKKMVNAVTFIKPKLIDNSNDKLLSSEQQNIENK